MIEPLRFLEGDERRVRKVLVGAGLMLAALALTFSIYSVWVWTALSWWVRVGLSVIMGAPALLCAFMLWGYHVEFLKNVATGQSAPLPDWARKWQYALRTARLFPLLILVSIPGNAFAVLYGWTGERWFLVVQQYIAAVFYLIGPAFAIDAVHQAGGMPRPGLKEFVRFAGRHFWALVAMQLLCPIALVVCAGAGALLLGVGVGAGLFVGSLVWTYSMGRRVRRELEVWRAAGSPCPPVGRVRAVGAVVALGVLFGAVVIAPMWHRLRGRTEVGGVAVGQKVRYAGWKLGHEGEERVHDDGSLWLEYPDLGLALRVEGNTAEGVHPWCTVREILVEEDPGVSPPSGLCWGCGEGTIRSQWGEPIESRADGSEKTLQYDGAQFTLQSNHLVRVRLF